MHGHLQGCIILQIPRLTPSSHPFPPAGPPSFRSAPRCHFFSPSLIRGSWMVWLFANIRYDGVYCLRSIPPRVWCALCCSRFRPRTRTVDMSKNMNQAAGSWREGRGFGVCCFFPRAPARLVGAVPSTSLRFVHGGRTTIYSSLRCCATVTSCFSM